MINNFKKGLTFFFLCSFVLFFVTKEILLLNTEFVFIVSFLIFFFVALDNVSDTVIASLDKHEQDIRLEFRKLLTLKLAEVRETRNLIYNLRPYHKAMLGFMKFMENYTRFLNIYKRKCIKANRRFLVTFELVGTFKQLVNRTRFINEANIRHGAFLIRKEMKKLRLEQKEIKHLKTIRSIERYRFKFKFLARRKPKLIKGKKRSILRPILKFRRFWKVKKKSF